VGGPQTGISTLSEVFWRYIWRILAGLGLKPPAYIICIGMLLEERKSPGNLIFGIPFPLQSTRSLKYRNAS
jgi:hypothetical protein